MYENVADQNAAILRGPLFTIDYMGDSAIFFTFY